MHTERNMKKWISLFGVVFVTLWLAGCSAESNVKKGDKFYAIGEYFEAAAEYRKAYMRAQPKERAKGGARASKAAAHLETETYIVFDKERTATQCPPFGLLPDADRG